MLSPGPSPVLPGSGYFPFFLSLRSNKVGASQSGGWGAIPGFGGKIEADGRDLSTTEELPSLMIQYRRQSDPEGPSASKEPGRTSPEDGRLLSQGRRSSGPPRSMGPKECGLRAVVRALASVDVMYALLLLGLHLLVLITGGSKSSKKIEPGSSGEVRGQNSSGLGTLDEENLNQTQKSQERLAVMIWIGMFAICILQLLVAGALYGGTNERDGRVCIRNSRIWSYTSVFLSSIIVFQLCGLLMTYGKAAFQKHGFAVTVYIIELTARLAGLFLIMRFIKEVKFELCDLDMDEHVVYYELQPAPSTPEPPKGGHGRRRQ